MLENQAYEKATENMKKDSSKAYFVAQRESGEWAVIPKQIYGALTAEEQDALVYVDFVQMVNGVLVSEEVKIDGILVADLY